MRLTDITIRALKPPERGQKMHWDNLTGFGVRVSQGGAKSFVLMHGRNRQLTTIGRVGIISLSEARTEAKRLLAEGVLHKGRRKSVAFETALTEFFETHCDQHNKPRVAKETRRLLTKYVLPGFRHDRLEDITHDAIVKRIRRLLGTPGTANHVFSAVRTFFNWTVPQYLDHSPCDGMDMPARIVKRERVLTDHELVRVWRAVDAQSEPFRSIVMLLILTGQRRQEIGGLHASYIDRDASTITLPGEITKNRMEHTFPFGKAAGAIILGKNAEGYLFESLRDPEKPFSGWSKCKLTLDKAVGEIPHWTLHDLRRTFSTNLASLKVPPHVTEKLINHITGTIQGVAAIYNRYAYMDEMRAAIALWEEKLQSLLNSCYAPPA